MSEEMIHEEKPGFFKRVATGIKSFVSHALGYIPRGIVLTGLVFAGSAAIESMTGMHLLGVTDMFNAGMSTGNWGALGARFATHLALGTAISGVLGGTIDAVNLGKHPAEYVQAPAGASIVKAEPGEVRAAEKLVGNVKETFQEVCCDAVVPGTGSPTHGLPAILKAATGQAR